MPVKSKTGNTVRSRGKRIRETSKQEKAQKRRKPPQPPKLKEETPAPIQAPPPTPATPPVNLIVCKGCGGNCRTCDGVVRPAKGAGRPKEFCCINCKGRATSRSHYRSHYVKNTDSQRRMQITDWRRLIDGHKRAGHEGQPCPRPMIGSRASCITLCELYDNMRESQGLNRMFVQMAQEGWAEE